MAHLRADVKKSRASQMEVHPLDSGAKRRGNMNGMNQQHLSTRFISVNDKDTTDIYFNIMSQILLGQAKYTTVNVTRASCIISKKTKI